MAVQLAADLLDDLRVRMPEQEHAIATGIQVAMAVHVVQIDAFGTHLDGQVHHRGQAGITRIDMVTVLRAHALGIKPFGQGGEAVHRLRPPWPVRHGARPLPEFSACVAWPKAWAPGMPR
ncbi:hypothetical protein D3C78_1586530 [compost metagenome]